MLIKKTIQTKLNITSANLLYSGDMDAVIMDNIRQRFEGYCYSSCLILEILKIIDHSNFVFSRQRQDASAECSVRFLVRGVIIKPLDILHNCTVRKINKDGHIICQNKHSAIYIKADKALQTIRQGQTIVALAGCITYTIAKPSISINALPFIPMFKDTIVYSMTIDNANGIVQKVYSAMMGEINTNSKLDQEVYMFFVKLLYPYRTMDLLNNMKKGSVTDISKIMTMSEGSRILISRPDCLPMDTPQVYLHNSIETDDVLKYEGIQKTEDGMTTTENYENIMGYIIHTYMEHLISLRHLCTTYPTMDAINDNSNLWDIYIKYRRP